MNTTKKLVVGVGIASGALLAALLFTGDPGHRQKTTMVRKARNFKNPQKESRAGYDDSEVHYI